MLGMPGAQKGSGGRVCLVSDVCPGFLSWGLRRGPGCGSQHAYSVLFLLGSPGRQPELWS